MADSTLETDVAVWEPTVKNRKMLRSIKPAYDPVFHPTLGFLERLPDDVLLRIFTFLPLATMGRVSCWSKGWGTFVEEPYTQRYYTEAQSRASELADAYKAADERWAEHYAPSPSSFPSYALYLGIVSFETLTWDCRLPATRIPLH